MATTHKESLHSGTPDKECLYSGHPTWRILLEWDSYTKNPYTMATPPKEYLLSGAHVYLFVYMYREREGDRETLHSCNAKFESLCTEHHA